VGASSDGVRSVLRWALCLFVLTGAASAAVAQPAAKPPSRLWYELELYVEWTYVGTYVNGTRDSHAIGWYARSKGAVIVKRVCNERKTNDRLGDGSCAAVFKGKRRPKNAVDDLAFLAAIDAVWEYYKFEQHLQPTSGTTSDGRPYHCSGFIETKRLSKPVLYEGRLGSSALRAEGFSVAFDRALKAGELTTTKSQSCVYDDDGEAWPPLNPEPPGPVAVPPWTFGHLLSEHRVINRPYPTPIAGNFGHGFTLSLRETKSSLDHKATVLVKLRFKLCPGGGLNPKRC
jgi:hypothetical protein